MCEKIYTASVCLVWVCGWVGWGGGGDSGTFLIWWRFELKIN